MGGFFKINARIIAHLIGLLFVLTLCNGNACYQMLQFFACFNGL